MNLGTPMSTYLISNVNLYTTVISDMSYQASKLGRVTSIGLTVTPGVFSVCLYFHISRHIKVE